MPAPSFNYTIKASQLNGETPLPDGDVIKLSWVEKDTVPVKFELTLGEKVSWWKGIVYFEAGKENAWREIAAGERKDLDKPDYRGMKGEIDEDTMKAGFLVLSKAKQFGVHTNVYLIQDAGDVFKKKNEYTITWIRDA